MASAASSWCAARPRKGFWLLVSSPPNALAEALPDAVEQGYLAKLDEAFRTGDAYTETGAKYAVQAVPGGPVTEKFVDFVYQPIKDGDGRVTGIFVQGADVTTRTWADAALQASEALFREMTEQLMQVLQREQDARAAADQADRAKDEFLAMLGHELRNPLAPILTALELMRLRADDRARTDGDRASGQASAPAR